MTARGRVAKARPPALSRDRILRAAIRMADQRGLDSVSMRNLATTLRSKPMSLYFHVRNKDELLSGMVDVIVAEFDPPAGAGDWKVALRTSLVSAYQVLRAHPWACALMLAATSSTARLRYTEAVLKVLRDAGFSPLATHRAYHIVDSHLVGFTLWEAGYLAQRDFSARVQKFLQAAPTEFPFTLEHARVHLSGVARSGRSEFEIGLDLILDSLERLRA